MNMISDITTTLEATSHLGNVEKQSSMRHLACNSWTGKLDMHLLMLFGEGFII